MDGAGTRISRAGALVIAAACCAVALADAPQADRLIDEPTPAATQGEVVADEGGVTIDDANPTQSAETQPPPSIYESADGQGAAAAAAISHQTTVPPAGSGETAQAQADAATEGVGDAGKRGDEGEGQTDAAAPRAPRRRSALPLGGGGGADRDGAKSEAGAGAARSPMGVLGGLGVLRTLGAVGVVLLLIVLARLILARAARIGAGGLRAQLGPGGRAPSGIVQILGRYPIARGHTLVLLKLDRRILLLSQTAAGFNTLSEISDAEDVASILTKSRDEEGESLTARFSTLLRRLERDPGFADADDVEIAPYLRRPSLDEVDGFAGELTGAEPESPDPEDPGQALRRRLEGLRGLSA